MFNYINWQKANKNKGDLWYSITQDDNLKTYDAIIKKMTDKRINKINPTKFDILQDKSYRKTFEKLTLDEQVLVLAELLNLITTKLTPNAKVLKLINMSASVKSIPFSLNGYELF